MDSYEERDDRTACPRQRGRLSHQLTERIFLPQFDNPLLRSLDDFATLSATPNRLAFTTDSYVVKPLFFAGGDIGKLSVCGTVNDLAMSGARPLYISTAFIIEEGLPLEVLSWVATGMKEAAMEAGVQIVAGDTKVVETGKVDGLFITTAGVGPIPYGLDISGGNAQPGDRIILSGTIGDHGIAVLSEREGLRFGTHIKSDCAPLNHLVAAMLEVAPIIHCLRDPTRGGLATTLNEIASQSGVAMRIKEDRIPIRDGVRAACEMFGFDPLYVANEGKLIAIVPRELATTVVERMRKEKYGKNAVIIGEVLEGPPGRVTMTTLIGGTRIVDMLTGEMLPRIC